MKVIRWSQEEWMQLANMMHKVRARNPELSFPQLGKKAQAKLVQEAIWKQDRVRELTGTHFMEPLKPLLRAIDIQCLDALKELPDLKAALEENKKQPTKEQMLDSLTPHEINVYFADSIFDNLTTAEVVKRVNIDRVLDTLDCTVLSTYIVGRMSRELAVKEQQNSDLRKILSAQQNTTAKVNGKKLKVAIIGTIGEQFTKLQTECGEHLDLIHIDKLHLDKQLPFFEGVVMLGNHVSSPQRSIIGIRAKANHVPKERIIIVNGISQAIHSLLTFK